MSDDKEIELCEPTNESQLRSWAFAKRLLEVVNVAEAYRDVFHPGKDILPGYHVSGTKLIKDDEVGKIIKHLAAPALVAAGVEREFALRRLIETIESDITDYADSAGSFMSLDEIRKKLTPEKRRLIRKYREQVDKDGNVTSRTIELEPKHQALELLARIQQLVQPSQLNVINNETIINVMNVAQQQAARRATEMRSVIEGSKTAGQMSRSSKAHDAVATLPAPETKTP